MKNIVTLESPFLPLDFYKLRFSRYLDSGSVCITICEAPLPGKRGNDLIDATYNHHYFRPEEGFVCICDSGPNEGLMRALINTGVIGEYVGIVSISNGFFYICPLIMKPELGDWL